MSVNVFAFGSNMCSDRFRDYGISPEGLGIPALLRDYRLRFNKKSQKDGSGKANVEPYERGTVWGVLYTIPDEDLLTLDSGEGRGYQRKQLPIQLTDGTMIEAWVYIATKPSNDRTLLPYTWYKRFLVEGAREHGLPAEYIEELEGIDATQDADMKRDQEKRQLKCVG